MMKPSTASSSHYTCFFLHGKVRSNSKTMASNHRKKSRQFYRRQAGRRKHHLVWTTLEKIFVLLTMLPCSQNKNRLKKMGRVRHNNFRLSKLVGKHSNANCNSFGKLRFFRKNNHVILLSRRRKIRPEPKLAPKAKLTSGLSIHYSGGSSLSKDVEKWLKKCGVSQK